MRNKILLFTIVCIALLSSCITPKDTNLLQDIPKDYLTEDLNLVDYKIIQGDQLLVTLFTKEESARKLFAGLISDRPVNTSMSFISNSGSNNSGGLASNTGNMGGIGGLGVADLPTNAFSVTSEGMLYIPYLGETNVLGMSPQEVKGIIERKFKQIVNDSNLTVDVTLLNKCFFVLGEAGTRQIQMNNLRMTIYQALAISGNIKIFGDKKNVKIIRQTVDGTEVKTFDLRSEDIVNSEYYYIQPNDVIYIPQLQRKFLGSLTSFTTIFGFVTSLAATTIGIITIVKRIN